MLEQMTNSTPPLKSVCEMSVNQQMELETIIEDQEEPQDEPMEEEFKEPENRSESSSVRTGPTQASS